MPTFACIVTFEPDLQVLAENVRAVTDQVEGVVIVDNGSSNLARIADELPASVLVHPMGANRGLSVAMNAAVGLASDLGADAVLMLDQDSVVVPGLVTLLEGDLDLHQDLAIAAPDIRDRNLGSDERPSRGGMERVDACITSGSLIRVADWKRVGGWDEQLFIDYVDFDFCLRVRLQGRSIGIDHATALHHSIGDARRSGAIVAWGHGASRLEHMAQDVLRYARKHRRTPTALQVVPNTLPRAMAVLAWKSLIIVLHEDAKRVKLRAIARGSIAGLRTHRT